MSFVYLITNNLSQKVYVGKANDLKSRWKAHRHDASRDRPKSCIGWALKKYGVENFTFSTLVSDVPEAEAYIQEVLWIASLHSNQPGVGYNLDSGGMGGKTSSEATRRKMSSSSARKGKPMPEGLLAKWHSPEARAKCAASHRGYRHTEISKAKMSAALKGRPKSPEAVRKLAAALRGRHPSEETRKKMSVAGKGRTKSQEHREKIGAAMRGKTRHPLTLEQREKLSLVLRGKPHSPEHREKLAEANRRRGLQSRLSWGVVQAIRILGEEGMLHRIIAQQFWISRTLVDNIINCAHPYDL